MADNLEDITSMTVCVVVLIITVAGLINLIFDIPNYEDLCERMHLYRTTAMIRSLKAYQLTDDEHMEQSNWTIEMNHLTREKHMLVQRNIFLKELIIEYAVKDKLHEIAKLDNYGPDDWQKKLQDQALRMQINRNRSYIHLTQKSDGPVIRQYKANLYWMRRSYEEDPIQHLSRRDLLDGCKARDGCCARKCQCCMKPRGLDDNGKKIYSHCTVFCGCCIRRRGYTIRDPEYGTGVAGFVDHAKEPLGIEDVNDRYPVT